MTGSLSNEALRSPSAARNRDPILAVLRTILPPRGTVLEIASGTGEHAVHFAAALPNITWQSTDLDAAALSSITAHIRAAGLLNHYRPFMEDGGHTVPSNAAFDVSLRTRVRNGVCAI